MTHSYRKKLIEVALPLDAINDASAYDKMPGIGPHPKGIHQWWARLPSPCARAVLFASVVDDPSDDPRFESLSEEAQNKERDRLFTIIRFLLQKDVRQTPQVFLDANKEMTRSAGAPLPLVLDLFSGGGTIPLEAQRLGFQAQGNDLNPVAVLISKALVEFLPRFTGHPAVNPTDNRSLTSPWSGAAGVAANIRFYARAIHAIAEAKLAHLYPSATLDREHGGGEANVIAWIWARSVSCPNPACGARMPLIHSYSLSTKKGSRTWLEPVVNRQQKTVEFRVVTGNGVPPDPPKLGRGAKFRCLVCEQIAPDNHIKSEGIAGRLGAQLLAIVAEGARGRVYRPARADHAQKAAEAEPSSSPDYALAYDPRNLWCTLYGLDTFAKLFSSRQLLALESLCEAIRCIRQCVLRDARTSAPNSNTQSLEDGGRGSEAYADLVTLFLAFGLDRAADFNNSVCRWNPSNEKVMNLFARQAIPMQWDFAEANVLATSVGGWLTCAEHVAESVEMSIYGLCRPGSVSQGDSASLHFNSHSLIVSTDPPYYDNISYANLSDFFYVWLRKMLGDVIPGVFGTLLTPKAEELVASPYLFDGDKHRAKTHFEQGFRKSLGSIRDALDPRFPLTIYYAFKQSENDGGRTDAVVDLTTGWETMLESLLCEGFQVTATWPVRASQAWRMVSMGTNALASYIVLVCRLRAADAPIATRRDFAIALNGELPEALRKLQHGNIAPVDLAQAAIGPGMAVFSRYSRVLEAGGEVLSVRAALRIINQALGEALTEQDDEYDTATRWAVAWFELFGLSDGPFGDAETLSKAKDVSVAWLEQAGVVRAKGGRVRLVSREELELDWQPVNDTRLTAWLLVQQLIRALNERGEAAAAGILAQVGGLGDIARDLAYRLYATCERKGWTHEAGSYNGLVVAWPEIARLVSSGLHVQGQERLL